jgi:hypothetical protein
MRQGRANIPAVRVRPSPPAPLLAQQLVAASALIAACPRRSRTMRPSRSAPMLREHPTDPAEIARCAVRGLSTSGEATDRGQSDAGGT